MKYLVFILGFIAIVMLVTLVPQSKGETAYPPPQTVVAVSATPSIPAPTFTPTPYPTPSGEEDMFPLPPILKYFKNFLPIILSQKPGK